MERDDDPEKSAELVRIAVDFAYLDEAKARNFSFSQYAKQSKEWIVNQN